MSYDTSWHYVGETGEPAFQNGYQNIVGGDCPLRFRRGIDGVVRIEGSVEAIPIKSYGTVFQLPEDYRPSYTISAPYNWCSSYSWDLLTCKIYSNGNTVLCKSPGNLYISFYIGGEEYFSFEIWEAGTYNINEIRIYNGTAYVSQVNSNTSTPGANNDWDELKGDKGDTGAIGATGKAFDTWTSGDAPYDINTIVAHNGLGYISQQNSNSVEPGTNDLYWKQAFTPSELDSQNVLTEESVFLIKE